MRSRMRRAYRFFCGGLFHRGGERCAVVVQQRLGQRGAAAAAHAFGSEPALRCLVWDFAGGVFVFLRKAIAFEVEVEAFVEQVLLVRCLSQHERQGVLQDGAVGEADYLHGAGGVDALGGGGADAGAAGSLEELAERFAGGHGTPPPGPLPKGEGER
jgi:hypothetical protein